MNKFILGVLGCILLSVGAFASATIDDLTTFERQATVKISVSGGHGSGVVISSDTILTARHVAVDGPAVLVTLQDGTEVSGAVTWMSADPAVDLALVTFNKPPGVRAAAVSCASLRTGQAVTVVGYPLMLSATVSHGQVLNGDPFVVPGYEVKFIATDAFIAPGNSGGPVYDAAGRVIGVASATMAKYGLRMFAPVTLAPELCPAK